MTEGASTRQMRWLILLVQLPLVPFEFFGAAAGTGRRGTSALPFATRSARASAAATLASAVRVAGGRAGGEIEKGDREGERETFQFPTAYAMG